MEFMKQVLFFYAKLAIVLKCKSTAENLFVQFRVQLVVNVKIPHQIKGDIYRGCRHQEARLIIAHFINQCRLSILYHLDVELVYELDNL